MFYAAAGIFIVLSQSVVARTREIGIRVALGAASADISRLIVAKGVLLTTLGVCGGVGASLAASRVLRALLYDVSPYDPASFAIVAALVVGLACVACWLPARRALRIDAAVALRVD